MMGAVDHMSRKLAVAYGSLVTVAMVGINVFPRHPFGDAYEHGRPLIYMTRQTRFDGPLTVYQCFWPFWNAPLAEFDGLYLAIDISLAALFVAASIFAAHRLLIRHSIPITFRLSLWHLMGWMTLFSIALAFGGPMVLGFLLLKLPMLVVCCSLVIIFLSVVDRRRPRVQR
jgi:hypothetical protein